MENALQREIEELKLQYAKVIRESKAYCAKFDTAPPSGLWQSVLPYFAHLSDLTPENLLNIRLHTEFLTGRGVYSHAHKTYRFFESDEEKETIPMIQKYIYFNQDIPQELWCSEPVTTPILDILGVEYKGNLINEDIVRYQSCISNLYRLGAEIFLCGGKNQGLFEASHESEKPTSFENRGRDRSLLVEIGGGYGGLMHQLRRGFGKKPVLVNVDLPELFIFSATYYAVNNPGSKTLIVTEDKREELKQWEEYDAIFLPNYALQELYKLPPCDVLINMLSFQEMTDLQLREYLFYAREQVKGFVYSDNFRRHWLNKELNTNVGKYFHEYLRTFPAIDAYDHSSEDKIQRINLLCKYVGVSPKYGYQLEPVAEYILGDEYMVKIQTGEVLIA